MPAVEVCRTEDFVAEATPQVSSLEEAGSTQEILIQQLEGYLSRLREATCLDLTSLQVQLDACDCSGGGGGGVAPYITIVHDDAAEDITVATIDILWVWSSIGFDTLGGAITFDGVSEITVVEGGTYQIDLHVQWRTTGNSRMFSRVERDPLGVGAFAEIIGSKNLGHFFGSDGDAYSTCNVVLNATDKLHVLTRRLFGGAPSTTRGGNGSTWRLTKLT